ncbi:MAG: hypothetical protein AAF488_15570 [Planctomycetota bacterium]
MKRRALTILLILAGIALLAAVGVQVYRSQRYVSYVSGLEVHDKADGCYWEFEAGHLRPKEGKFRGWYLSVDPRAATARVPESNPDLVLTERPSGFSRWSLREKDSQTYIAHRGPSYDEWPLSFLPLSRGRRGILGRNDRRSWFIYLQPPHSTSWLCRLADSEHGVLIEVEGGGETRFLKPPTDAKVETFDHWADPDPLPPFGTLAPELEVVK